MSEGQSAGMLWSSGVKAGMAHSICGCTCGWQVKLCDPSLTRAVPERIDIKNISLQIKKKHKTSFLNFHENVKNMPNASFPLQVYNSTAIRFSPFNSLFIAVTNHELVSKSDSIAIRYRSTDQANSAFHPFGVDKWVLSFNSMSAASVRGSAIWWTLTKERQAWCVCR